MPPATPRRRRQLLLFLLAVLLPSALVSGLAWRLAQQDRELRAREAQEAAQRAALELGRHVFVHLERMRLAQLTQPAHRPAALRLRITTSEAAAGVATPTDAATSAFRTVLRQAEAAEYGSSARAARPLYEHALDIAPGPRDSALARLGIARVTASSSPATARAQLRTVLGATPDTRDEDGVPIALYAAHRLAQWPEEHNAISASLLSFVGPQASPNAIGAYMLADITALLTAANDSSIHLLRDRTRDAVRDAEQALAIASDLPVLLRMTARDDVTRGAAWRPFGDPVWLVGIGPSATADDTLVLAFDAGEVLAMVAADSALQGTALAGARLAAANEPGLPLGPELPGLRAVLPADDAGSAGGSLGAALLALLVGVTLFSAYLFWRDVQREATTAQLRSRFVASVSHELKTPLTSIRMFAETLRMGRASTARQSEYLDTIVGESERLSRLINNVLDFSRIEEGRREYNRVPTDLADVVRDAARVMSYPLAAESFELHTNIDDNVPAVSADRDAVMQAVLNLLSNAVKFSNGKRQIELSLSADSGRALIGVRDQGVGIAPAEQARIFEKYYRSPEAEHRGIAGAGLGLALVAHIAESHDGGIDVESSPNAGSTFTLWLPIRGDS